MAKTVLVVDELDGKLGTFFQLCQNDLFIYFNGTTFKPTLLNSNQLNDLSVQLTTAPLDKFVFGAYSHGGNKLFGKG